ncbi:response regulator [Kribbia dieselivorans]|uniref:response regulator n=1 Tax=Kribbia dieselivorans TaxID=331526 RepID=UPI001C3F3250|nr:response regulator transcription factor [Kribbia dieselivorans]
MAPTSEVRVLIVDDNAIVRMGIRSLLESEDDLVVVGEAADGEEALRAAAQYRPDVVLLDVRMPKRDGVSVVRELAAAAAVLMLTFTDEAEIVRQAVTEGAAGYLVHGTFDAATLAQSVRSAAIGSGSFTAGALAALRNDLASPPAAGLRSGNHGLSRRQAEVMDAIAAGRSNGQIARDLFLSEKTVKNHINAIFMRLEVTTRAEAIAVWLGTKVA